MPTSRGGRGREQERPWGEVGLSPHVKELQTAQSPRLRQATTGTRSPASSGSLHGGFIILSTHRTGQQHGGRDELTPGEFKVSGLAHLSSDSRLSQEATPDFLRGLVLRWHWKDSRSEGRQSLKMSPCEHLAITVTLKADRNRVDFWFTGGGHVRVAGWRRGLRVPSALSCRPSLHQGS